MDRVTAAQRILDARGLEATVRAAGPEDEIAAITGVAALRPALAELAEELRATGFQYVALEVEPDSYTNTDS